MEQIPLEYAETLVTLAKRSDGERGVLVEEADISDEVYNNLTASTSVPPLPAVPPTHPWWKGFPQCWQNWAWHPDLRSDMLPYTIRGKSMEGAFIQTSNAAVVRGIRVGSWYRIVFDKESCEYTIYFRACPTEQGVVSYTRASDNSQTNGGGGNYRYATLHFASREKPYRRWRALLIANNKNSGVFESEFGIASFAIM